MKDLLIGDPVRNWEFLLAIPSVTALGHEIDPRKILRRRSSLVVADMAVHWTGSHTNTHIKSSASVFKEPEASSLLDSFGF
jgi:hypothetical protein